MLFARPREGEHGGSREWSFKGELTLSRQRQDFRVVLRVVLWVVLRVILADLGAEDWRLRQVSRDILGQILECFVRLEGRSSRMEA